MFNFGWAEYIDRTWSDPVQSSGKVRPFSEFRAEVEKTRSPQLALPLRCSAALQSQLALSELANMYRVVWLKKMAISKFNLRVLYGFEPWPWDKCPERPRFWRWDGTGRHTQHGPRSHSLSHGASMVFSAMSAECSTKCCIFETSAGPSSPCSFSFSRYQDSNWSYQSKHITYYSSIQ